MSDSITYQYQVLEGVILFIAAPLLFFWDMISVPKIAALVAASGYCGIRLWREPGFDLLSYLKPESQEGGKIILRRLPFVIVILLGIVFYLFPDQFLAFPKERPIIWVVVMVLYPLLSALPQELIFRSYFFHRYEDVLPTRYGTVIASAAAFSFLHIIYDNWWAVGLSFIAGILFGITYKKTRSLFWVTVEHAIYGCLVFTIGLGSFFYEPF